MTKPVGILVSLTYYFPYVSGLSFHAKMIAEALAIRHRVSVLSMRFDRKLPKEELIQGVKVVRADTLFQISKGFISIDWLWQSFKAILDHDVLLLHLPQFEGAITAVIARLFNKKIIIFYHCDVVLPQSLLNKIAGWFLDLSSRISLSLASTILHSTKDFAQNSVMLKDYLKKMQFIYPPIIYRSTDNRTIKLLEGKISTDRINIGIVARIAQEKGIEYLLDAIPLLKFKFKDRPFAIFIVGPTDPVGENTYKEKIYRLIDIYRDNIKLLGKLRESEIGAFYKLMDCLVLPSVNSTESFGTVQVEAMSFGTPVVVSDLPGVRVPVQKTGMGIVVPPENSRKIAEAIYEIVQNKSKYQKPVSFIKNEFSFARTLDCYEKKIYQTNSS